MSEKKALKKPKNAISLAFSFFAKYVSAIVGNAFSFLIAANNDN